VASQRVPIGSEYCVWRQFGMQTLGCQGHLHTSGLRKTAQFRHSLMRDLSKPSLLWLPGVFTLGSVNMSFWPTGLLE
jgi:hypothetical protein